MLRGIVIAIIITCIVIFGTVWLPGDILPANDVSSRLVFVLKWDVLLFVCLAVGIGVLARHRFLTTQDIDVGGLSWGTAKARILQSILQNTLEQVVLAALVHLVWAVLMPTYWGGAIAGAATLFLIGRSLFWHGYADGAPTRGLGFGLTFYPSVLMLAVLIVFLITGQIK